MNVEIPAKMAMLSTETFTTSTPLHQQHDSGFYENTPESISLSQASAVQHFHPNFYTLRRSLFVKRRCCENIPNEQFSQENKLLLSRSAIFPRRNTNSNKETPRRCAFSRKPIHFAESKTCRRTPPFLSPSACVALFQKSRNESGFVDETPEKSTSPKSESTEIPFFKKIEKLHESKQNPKEECLAYLKHSLNVSGDKNNADISLSQLLRLYYIHRFQRMGLKPSAAAVGFNEQHLHISEMTKEDEMFLLSWKNKLECISGNLEEELKIDLFNQLHMMNLDFIINKILSYLSGRNLQSVSCVSQMWRKLVFADEHANAARLSYFEELQKSRQENEFKLLNPFQRPPNLRILGCSDNIQQKEQLQVKRTIKEMNFEAFVEVGKSGNKQKTMKCLSCGCLSLRDKQIITKCTCLFCGYEFCCNCSKPYSDWHFCSSAYTPALRPPAKSKRFLRRL